MFIFKKNKIYDNHFTYDRILLNEFMNFYANFISLKSLNRFDNKTIKKLIRCMND